MPLLARNCLKSAIFMSPTKTVSCDGGGVERGSKDSEPLSVFPTSASTQATSQSPSCNHDDLPSFTSEREAERDVKRQIPYYCSHPLNVDLFSCVYLLKQHIAHQLLRELDLFCIQGENVNLHFRRKMRSLQKHQVCFEAYLVST